jgi:HK97 family phage prohead protease
MGAIEYQKTKTSDAAWDGPMAKTNLKLDQEKSYYYKAYAWENPEGDPIKKETYKFIHHEVDSNGNIGAANIKGCQSAIGVLNGGRGGTKIPKDDYQGVYNHLAHHLRDADLEPAELKRSLFPLIQKGKPERRVIPYSELQFKYEERSEEQPSKIYGQVALFNRMSEEMRGFREKISPGCFKKTLDEADIRALMNHDPNYVLGRNTSGTLKLWEDNIGLNMECEPPDTQWAKDLMVSMKRGDVDQMSFGFRVIKDSWDEVDGEIIRTLIECELFDVSVVTYPAYLMTSASVRSLLYSNEFRDLAELIERVNRGETLNEADHETINQNFEKLKSLAIPVTEPEKDGSVSVSEPENHSEKVTETGKNHSNQEGQTPPSFDETRAKARQRELDLLQMQMQIKGGH